MKALAAVSHEKGKMGIEEIDVAEPKTGEVLVKVLAAGVCHTDEAGLHQLFPVPLPAVYGHEGVGIVEKVGDNVSSLAEGDKVILTFPSDGTCPLCLDGHPYACNNMLELFWGGRHADGSTPFTQDGVDVSTFFAQGSFSQYTVVSARDAVKVDVSEDDLKNLCSLGCGVQTGVGAVLHGLKAEPKGSLAVFGAGGVGMSAIMGGVLAGCYPIIAVDVVPSRLELAKELGATHTVNAKEVDDVIEEIRKITDGGAHYSIESSGIPALTLQALDCLRKLGKCCQVSVTGPATIELPIEPLILSKNVTFLGLAEGASNPQVFIPELVEYYKQGRLPADKLVKHYDFKDIDKAFEDAHTGVTIKPILVF